MTRYLVHAGTGTIINADDGVYLIDTEILIPENTAIMENGDETEIVELAQKIGQPINDLTYGNVMSFSPSAIREEIRESLWEGYPEDHDLLEWAESQPDSVLNQIAQYILQDDSLWNEYPSLLMDGLRQGRAWARHQDS